MAAPKGNEFWKLRSKHGVDKLFASPELLWKEACFYFKWIDDNPFYETKPMVVAVGDNMGSTITYAKIPKIRPYTLGGLCLYLGVSEAYFRAFKYEHKSEKDKVKEKDFLTVIEVITQTIYQQKFSGAAAGFLNANIISRDLGLADKRDNTHTINNPVIIDWGADSNKTDTKAKGGKKSS